MKHLIIALATIFILPIAVNAATLSVSPSSQSVRTGEIFSVNVNLDTQGASIDGVDLRYLNYNPALLQVQDANPGVSGVQITPGSLMSATLLNKVDQNSGKISFSQVASGGTKYKGAGTLAKISFKALAAGSAQVSFNYASNSTTDSNVAVAGSDALNAVVNGVYTITGTGSIVKPVNPGTPVVSPTTPNIDDDNSPTDPNNLNRVPSGDFVPLTPDEVDNSTNDEKSASNIFIYIISRIKNGFMRLFGK